MEFRFFADKSRQTLSIRILPNTPVDKLVQDIATCLIYLSHLAKCTEKQKAWLETNRWQVVVTPLTNLMDLSSRPVEAADG